MPLVNMRDMLVHAYRNGYAVGSFDLKTIDGLAAVIEAAEHTRSPVILSVTETKFGELDLELIMAATERAAQRAAVPVAIAMDRAADVDSAVRAIRYGSNGVIVEAGQRAFPDNVTHTRQVVDMAHACGVAVGGELSAGTIDGEEPAITLQAGSCTSVKEAEAFVARTGVDFFAVTLGSNPARSRAKGRLDFDRLRKINEALHMPLALRGDHGMSDDQIRRLIAYGVAKINCGIAAIAPYNGTRDTLRNEAERCMVLWGSAGRAAEVVAQCEVWQMIEHVIVYNGNIMSDMPAMIAIGRDVLSRIPGVRRVISGHAVHDGAKYQFCWIIEFAHRKVIESYRDHPVHREFADTYFRPLAQDRLTIDFASIASVDKVTVRPTSENKSAMGGTTRTHATYDWGSVTA